VNPDAAAKIVLTGPVGAGKTSAIRAISDGDALSTEMPWSDPSQPGKSTTTVALDFAHIVLDDGTPVLVYGLPGQDHFAFMRPIVLEGAAGAIILLDGRDADLARHCEDWLSSVASIAPAAARVLVAAGACRGALPRPAGAGLHARCPRPRAGPATGPRHGAGGGVTRATAASPPARRPCHRQLARVL